jgi:hypothetical protein
MMKRERSWNAGFSMKWTGLAHRLPGSVIMPATGILYLVINDYPFYRHGNRGRLRVSIARE